MEKKIQPSDLWLPEVGVSRMGTGCSQKVQTSSFMSKISIVCLFLFIHLTTTNIIYSMAGTVISAYEY